MKHTRAVTSILLLMCSFSLVVGMKVPQGTGKKAVSFIILDALRGRSPKTTPHTSPRDPSPYCTSKDKVNATTEENKRKSRSLTDEEVAFIKKTAAVQALAQSTSEAKEASAENLLDARPFETKVVS